MGLNVFLMLGSIKDAAMLLIHSAFFNFYLFQILYGDWNRILIKGYLYAVMAVITLYLAFSGKSQINLINSITFSFNFALFYLTLIGAFENSLFYMLLYNGSIIVLTTIVLTSGIRHGYFKQANEND